MDESLLPARRARVAAICRMSAAAAVEAMRRGELRAEDYVRALLDRAHERRDLNAFVSHDREAVLAAARAADARRDRGGKLGLLHGLPLPVKDSVNTRELPTTNATRALLGFRPRRDAAVLGRLFAAGAYLMGKTNLHEMSRGWTSRASVFGPTRNARDAARVPGGSSGGSATAVAAGVAPLAVAEDTWGSIRVPAAMCGIAGLRPSLDRYPNSGIMPLTLGRFDQVGPVARSVADLALFDAVVTGGGEPLVAAPLHGVRLGVPEDFVSDLDREVEGVFAEACRKLEAAGVELVRVMLPIEARGCADFATTIIGHESSRAIAAFLRDEGAGITFEQLLAQADPSLQERYASPPSAGDYEAALAGREAVKAVLPDFYRATGIEALVFPPLLATPPRVDDLGDIPVNGIHTSIFTVVGRNTALGNCGSLCSLVLPAGNAGNGLPVGIELDAPAGADARLLSLGLALEAAL